MDPFDGLSRGDRQIVTMIAVAIANGGSTATIAMAPLRRGVFSRR